MNIFIFFEKNQQKLGEEFSLFLEKKFNAKSKLKEINSPVVFETLQKSVIFIIDSLGFEIIKFKKTLLSKQLDFLAVSQHFYKTNSFLISPVSTDLGSYFRDASKRYFLQKKINKIPELKQNKFLNFNFKQTVIELPKLSEILPKHLLYFRYPNYIFRQTIKEILKNSNKHSEIKILTKNLKESSDELLKDWKKAFGKRAVFIKNAKINKNDTVLTFSTQKFFQILDFGASPLPITKCLAESLIHKQLKKNGFSNLSLNLSEVDDLKLFIEEFLTLDNSENFLKRKMFPILNGVKYHKIFC